MIKCRINRLKIKFSILIAIFIVFSISLVTSIMAVTDINVKIFDEETVTVHTYNDASVMSDSPDSNFDLETKMLLSKSNQSESVIFLYFHLDNDAYSGTAPKLGDNILRAIFTFELCYDSDNVDNLLVGAYYCSNNSWFEGNITWNNAPWDQVSSTPFDVDRGKYDKSNYEDSYVYDLTPILSQILASREFTIVLRAEEMGQINVWSHNSFSTPGMMAHLYFAYIRADTYDEVPITKEYSSGVLDNMIWYSWINTGQTELIYMVAMMADYGSYFPSYNMLAQRFIGANGVEYIVGHISMGFELYRDINGNGVLDANITSNDVETVYYLDINITESFEPSPVITETINGITHYKWAVSYYDSWGFVLYQNRTLHPSSDIAAILTIPKLEVSYDYFVANNVSTIKTSLFMGEATVIEQMEEGFSLDNLSIAATYTSLLLASSSDITVISKDEVHNSMDPDQQISPCDNLSIVNNKTIFYDLLFDENYILYRSTNETYPAISTIANWNSISPDIIKGHYSLALNQITGYLKGLLPRLTNLTIPADFGYYNRSILLYRVNYAQWDGKAFYHDPTYRAFLSGNKLDNILNDTMSDLLSDIKNFISIPNFGLATAVLFLSTVGTYVIVRGLESRKKFKY